MRRNTPAIMSSNTPPDDGSEDRGPEGATGQAMNRLEARIDGVMEMVERLEETVAELETENQRLRDRLDDERQAREELERRLNREIGELDNRTNWLRLVEKADQSDGEERSRALLQHMRRKAAQNRREGKDPHVRVDREQAEAALHHPDIDRSTYYSDMRRVERLVADEDVCSYSGGELELDLTEGTVRLPRPKDDRGDAQQVAATDGGCGGSTTDSTGVGGRKTGDSAGDETNQTR